MLHPVIPLVSACGPPAASSSFSCSLVYSLGFECPPASPLLISFGSTNHIVFSGLSAPLLPGRIAAVSFRSPYW